MLADPKPRKWFEEWREPGQFYRAANRGLGVLYNEATDRHLGSPEYQYLRDAYHAGVFARIWRDDQGSCEVRLLTKEECFPDAKLRPESGGVCIHIEITNARSKNSKMFEELRELRERGSGPVESLEQRQASARGNPKGSEKEGRTLLTRR
jgi:hypothetical protein